MNVQKCILFSDFLPGLVVEGYDDGGGREILGPGPLPPAAGGAAGVGHRAVDRQAVRGGLFLN